MDWGQKLRKQADYAQLEKLREREENLKKAKDELTKFMNSSLGEVLEKASNNGLTDFRWNNANTRRVCVDMCSMVGMYGAKAVTSAFEAIGLKFTASTFGYDSGGALNSYVISW